MMSSEQIKSTKYCLEESDYQSSDENQVENHQTTSDKQVDDQETVRSDDATDLQSTDCDQSTNQQHLTDTSNHRPNSIQSDHSSTNHQNSQHSNGEQQLDGQDTKTRRSDQLQSTDSSNNQLQSAGSSNNQLQSISSDSTIDKHRNDEHLSDEHSIDKHSNVKHRNDEHLSDKHPNDKHSNDGHSVDKHPINKHPVVVKNTNDKLQNDKHQNDKRSVTKNSGDKHRTEKSTTVVQSNGPTVNQVNRNLSINQQLDQLNLILTWTLRDDLIIYLNKMSALLLSNNSISNDLREQLSEEHLSLVFKLIDLSIESTDDSMAVLVLPRRKRTKIINHLIANLDSAIQFGHTISVQAKRELVNENTELIQLLMRLDAKVRCVRCRPVVEQSK